MTRDLEKEYAEAVGHEARNLPDDHPDKWQWDYVGTKAEREFLLERLELVDPEAEPTQEETLF